MHPDNGPCAPITVAGKQGQLLCVAVLALLFSALPCLPPLRPHVVDDLIGERHRLVVREGVRLLTLRETSKEGAAGSLPPTPYLAGRRPPQKHTGVRLALLQLNLISLKEPGAQDGNRTHDLRLTKKARRILAILYTKSRCVSKTASFFEIFGIACCYIIRRCTAQRSTTRTASAR